jgi:hypothetical protein
MMEILIFRQGLYRMAIKTKGTCNTNFMTYKTIQYRLQYFSVRYNLDQDGFFLPVFSKTSSYLAQGR